MCHTFTCTIMYIHTPHIVHTCIHWVVLHTSQWVQQSYKSRNAHYHESLTFTRFWCTRRLIIAEFACCMSISTLNKTAATYLSSPKIPNGHRSKGRKRIKNHSPSHVCTVAYLLWTIIQASYMCASVALFWLGLTIAFKSTYLLVSVEMANSTLGHLRTSSIHRSFAKE